MTNEKPKNHRVFEKLTEGSYEGLSIYRNLKSKYQPAFIGYLKDDKTRAISISGFPARQLADSNVGTDIFDFGKYTFDLEVELKYSPKYEQEYLAIVNAIKHKKTESIQKKLEIEGED